MEDLYYEIFGFWIIKDQRSTIKNNETLNGMHNQ